MSNNKYMLRIWAVWKIPYQQNKDKRKRTIFSHKRFLNIAVHIWNQNTNDFRNRFVKIEY